MEVDMQTKNLTGVMLDYWVARALGRAAKLRDNCCHVRISSQWVAFRPSTNWAECGPLVEEFRLDINNYHDAAWVATYFETGIEESGHTPQEAICRCVVKGRFGDVVPEA
jgi:hypothetical protein